jgi:hypothetical protein
LLAQLERIAVPTLLDERFPTPGNGQALSLGGMTTVWLTHILRARGDHAIGLIQLLSVGLRVLTLPEFIVRLQLATHRGKMARLCAWNPDRVPVQPTAELSLQTFQELIETMTHKRRNTHRHFMPLSRPIAASRAARFPRSCP